ncbi:MAG: hypothetical protein ACRDYA_07750 [Egibacteraceae bacterium]
MAEPLVICCLRVNQTPIPAAGSRPSRCTGCGAAVWVAPSSQRMMRQGGQPTCLECLSVTDEDLEFEAPTAEQLDEVRAELRRRNQSPSN